jgi:nucleoid-associated protein YgaU
MKILNILVVLLAVSLYRCSSSDVEKEKGEKELVTEVEQSLNDQPAPVAPEENLFFDEKAAPEVTEVAAPAVVEEIVAETPVEQPKVEETKPESSVKITEAGEYIVEKGDTLLLISFKLYGDYRKWRQILAENPGISANNLAAGKLIKYTQPENQFEWIKRGNAHLILKGDTLGTISNQYYGTIKRWKDIYKNNQPMILDPNLIFAGFTLYYVPDKMAQN